MSVFESSPSTPPVVRAELPLLDDAQLAAAAFLARYSGQRSSPTAATCVRAPSIGRSHRFGVSDAAIWAGSVPFGHLGGLRDNSCHGAHPDRA